MQRTNPNAVDVDELADRAGVKRWQAIRLVTDLQHDDAFGSGKPLSI